MKSEPQVSLDELLEGDLPRVSAPDQSEELDTDGEHPVDLPLPLEAKLAAVCAKNWQELSKEEKHLFGSVDQYVQVLTIEFRVMLFRLYSLVILLPWAIAAGEESPAHYKGLEVFLISISLILFLHAWAMLEDFLESRGLSRSDEFILKIADPRLGSHRKKYRRDLEAKLEKLGITSAQDYDFDRTIKILSESVYLKGEKLRMQMKKRESKKLNFEQDSETVR